MTLKGNHSYDARHKLIYQSASIWYSEYETLPPINRRGPVSGRTMSTLRGDGTHRVSLDEVLATMRATGRDMSSKYKETSTGGLAVNVSVNYVGC